MTMNRWRDIPGLEESTEMTILTQSNLQIQQSLSNHQGHFSHRLEQKISQCVWKHKKITSSQNNLEKEKTELEKSTFLTSGNLQSNKIVWYWHKKEI